MPALARALKEDERWLPGTARPLPVLPRYLQADVPLVVREMGGDGTADHHLFQAAQQRLFGHCRSNHRRN
jgi:hypothetical protein